MLEGILGLVIFVLDVWAILQVIGSSSSTAAKILWSLIIIILPVIGLIIWWLMGPKSAVA